MKRFISICLILALSLAFTSSAYAIDAPTSQETKSILSHSQVLSKINQISVSESEKASLQTLQSKIISDIEELKQEDRTNIDKECTVTIETKFDLTDDLRAVKLSLSEPVVIYQENISKTYDSKTLQYSELDNTSFDGLISNTFSVNITPCSYPTGTLCEDTRSRYLTFNGIQTKMSPTLEYYYLDDYESVGRSGYRLVGVNLAYSASSWAHVSYVYAEHHQEGNTEVTASGEGYDFEYVFDGEDNISDRTSQTFSLYSTSGSVDWDRPSNNTYAFLVYPSNTGGCIGTKYTYTFTYSLNGGWATYDYEDYNWIGTLPG